MTKEVLSTELRFYTVLDTT